ncbi:MAG: hypothetical protein ACPGOY_12500 [Rhodospirillaceae bacterium]
MSVEDRYGAQVESEFLEEISDTVSELQVILGNIRSGGVNRQDGFDNFGGQLARMRLMGAASHFPLLDLCVRRVSDYIADPEELSEGNLDDLDVFVDVMSGLVSGEIPPETDEAEFFRSLPARRPVDLADVAHLNVEILLVEPNKAGATFIKRELESGGYKVTAVRRSIEALVLATRTKPDMVISAAVLDHLSGIDLACALAAMPATEKIPFCLVSSFERSNAFVARLPDSAAFLRKGTNFSKDMGDALTRFGIA